MTSQAAQLGYLPRVRVAHTSSHQIGQIYLPGLNWTLMIACVAVTIGFRRRTRLPRRSVSRWRGRWPSRRSCLPWCPPPMELVAAARHSRCGTLLIIDAAFLGANLLKIAAGGWFPLLLAAVVFTLMATWTRGRALLRADYEARAMPAEDFVASIAGAPPPRVRGVAVFMHGTTVTFRSRSYTISSTIGFSMRRL